MNLLVKSVAAAASAAAMILAAAPASAATYISYLEWWDVNGPTKVSEPNRFGEVQLEEIDANTVKVTGVLYNDAKWQQSGANNIFAFNLFGPNADNTTVTENYSDPNVVYQPTSYTHAPWGTFTDHFNVLNSRGRVASGSNGRLPAAFEFTAFNAGGLTFAGVGATFDQDGRLNGLGSGNRFNSNAGGWWFIGHIQPVGSASINIAARDAFCIDCGGITAVPEPSTWTMMILGFGGAGALIRRRRYAIA